MIPTHAIIFKKRKVQVLHYHRDGCFFVLDRGQKVLVHHDSLIFLKNQSK